jgi:DDE superfamily endonuclease
MEFKRL